MPTYPGGSANTYPTAAAASAALGPILLADYDFTADGVDDYTNAGTRPASFAGLTPTYNIGTVASFGTDGSTGLVLDDSGVDALGEIQFPFSELAGIMTRSPAAGDRFAFCLEWVASAYSVITTSARLVIANAANNNGALGGHWKTGADSRRIVLFEGGFTDVVDDSTAAQSIVGWLGVDQVEMFTADASLNTTAPPSESGPFLLSLDKSADFSGGGAEWDPIAPSGFFSAFQFKGANDTAACTVKRFQVWLAPGSSYTP